MLDPVAYERETSTIFGKLLNHTPCSQLETKPLAGKIMNLYYELYEPL
jgi:hypothetical protein